MKFIKTDAAAFSLFQDKQQDGKTCPGIAVDWEGNFGLW